MNSYSYILDVNLENQLMSFLHEDGANNMLHLQQAHPKNMVKTKIKWKSNLVVAGMPFICFYLDKFCKNEKLSENCKILMDLEGKNVSKGDETELMLPFASFIVLERTMLNILHRLGAIATTTKMFVDKTKNSGIKILDTRKTTPGLRSFERYAVRIGGGINHRNDLSDALMIKDNHKTFWGGLKPAWDFYSKQKNFYQPIIVEIHSLEELVLAQEIGVVHFMLDNFSKEQIQQAVKLKRPANTFEISGGINLENLENYLLPGIDAISLSTISFWPAKVDISWKVIS